MPTPQTTIIIYALTINTIAFLLYTIDKQLAILGKWRVRESLLLAVGFAGGCFGAYAAMKVMHHKTRKPAFAVGVPMTMLVYLVFGAAAFLLR